VFGAVATLEFTSQDDASITLRVGAEEDTNPETGGIVIGGFPWLV